MPEHNHHQHFSSTERSPAPIRRLLHCRRVPGSIRNIRKRLRHICSHGENTARHAQDHEAIRPVLLCIRDRDNNRPKRSHALPPVYTTSPLAAHRDGLHRNFLQRLLLRGVLVLPLCEPSRFRHTVFCIRGSPNNIAPVPIALLPLRSRRVVVIFQIAGPYLPNIYCYLQAVRLDWLLFRPLSSMAKRMKFFSSRFFSKPE